MLGVAHTILPALIGGALAASAAALLIAVTKGLHGRFSMDGTAGVQKFHTAPTPRIGGVAFLLGSIASALLLPAEASALMWMVLLAGLPAFAAGLLEDITKKASPRSRLLATMLSGLVFALPFGYAATLADTQWISNLIPAGPPVHAFTVLLLCVGMAGVANAVNIVDGFHGLASGSLVIMHLAFASLTALHGDVATASLALAFAAISLGFLVVNFPMGRIFLGDAGAYFGGFALAAVARTATARTEAISPFVCLLVIFYPIWETLFSIHRKRRREGHRPSQPDGVHMHMLASRSLARVLAQWIGRPGARNALTGALMWPMSGICALMAASSGGSGVAAVLGCVAFALLYGRIYRIVSLQSSAALNRIERAVHRRRSRRVSRGAGS